jgi:PHP family Zn ribbon phosphoesterase
MATKSNTKEFKEKVKKLVGIEYTVLGEYINSKTKIRILHGKCGYEYKVTPNDFTSGYRCPKCGGTMPKNTEIFKKEVFDFEGKEYEVLGEYVNSSTKIKMLHSKCGYEYEVTPNDFIQSTRCPQCFGTPLKTTEQFKKEVFDLEGNEYTVLDEYINGKTKIRMLHGKCGFEYKVTPFNFISGKRCPKCGGTMPKNTEQFKKEVTDLVGNEYEVLGEYTNTNTKIKILHSKCGHEYKVKPSDFLRGIRCPKCFGTPLKTTEQFKKEVFGLVGNEYEVLGDYIRGKIKIGMLHSKCGYEYAVTPFSFISGVRCPKCGGTMPKNTEQFIKEVFDLVGNEYEVLGEYINNRIKIKILHSKCGYEYKVKPSDFIQGVRCGNCQ